MTPCSLMAPILECLVTYLLRWLSTYCMLWGSSLVWNLNITGCEGRLRELRVFSNFSKCCSDCIELSYGWEISSENVFGNESYLKKDIFKKSQEALYKTYIVFYNSGRKFGFLKKGSGLWTGSESCICWRKGQLFAIWLWWFVCFVNCNANSILVGISNSGRNWIYFSFYN